MFNFIMADLSQAYDSLKPLIFDQHTSPRYLHKCIYCGSNNVSAITNDGGSHQMCNYCGKSYRAQIINNNHKSNLLVPSRYDIMRDD